jgi:hypothetical protein
MTLRSSPEQPPRSPAVVTHVGAAAWRAAIRRDVPIWLATVAALLIMFGLLQNPYWVPGGDSELYVSIARNLLLGNGYMFNGVGTQIAPRGWPIMMAALMWCRRRFFC